MGYGVGFRCNCGYEVNFLFSVGFRGYPRKFSRLDDIEASPVFLDLKKRKRLHFQGAYRCNTCNTICQENDALFIFSRNLKDENLDNVYVRGNVTFLNEVPKCKKCKKELEFLCLAEKSVNISKIPCPKCGNSFREDVVANIRWD